MADILEIGFLLVLAVALLGGLWIGRGREIGKDRQDHPPRHPAPAPAPVRSPTPMHPAPFDESSASRLPELRVITGPARVVDGDTIIIGQTQIRLFGIDAPELDHPYGQKSRWALIGLCRNRLVTAEIRETDHYGRTVARCLLPDGRDLSAEMVKRGWAIDWPKFSGGAYANLESPDLRRKLFLADARQKGRMDVWARFDARKAARSARKSD